MSYAKLVCKSNRSLKRVFTRKDENIRGVRDQASAVEIVKRVQTKTADVLTEVITFEDGKKVRVTYSDVQD